MKRIELGTMLLLLVGSVGAAPTAVDPRIRDAIESVKASD